MNISVLSTYSNLLNTLLWIFIAYKGWALGVVNEKYKYISIHVLFSFFFQFNTFTNKLLSLIQLKLIGKSQSTKATKANLILYISKISHIARYKIKAFEELSRSNN